MRPAARTAVKSARTGRSNFKPSHQFRQPRAKAPSADLAQAGVALATELLSQRAVSTDSAHLALERLRDRAQAIGAAMWMVTDNGARCLLQVGAAVADDGRAVATPLVSAVVIERLRRHGALMCHSNESVGVEPLVPAEARSFVVAAGPGPGTELGVLVLAWDHPYPACDDAAVAPLRIAASLLERALAPPLQEPWSLSESSVAALPYPIVVVNSAGTILATNPAWVDMQRWLEVRALGRLGDNYFLLWGRAGAFRVPSAASIVKRVAEVAEGHRDFFQTVYACDELGSTQRWVLTATPLEHARRGAVVAHVPLAAEDVTHLAQQVGDKRFQTVADAVPLPIWHLAPDGGLVHGNLRWMELIGSAHGNGNGEALWADLFHPDDRTLALDALLTAAKGSPFELELRIRNANDAYSWMVCKGAPLLAGNGRLEGFVGFCCDITAKRQAERNLSELAAKLVAAQEDERSRVGRELHDDVAQQTALLGVKLTALAHPRLSRTQLRAGLLDAEQSLQELAASIHDLSHRLHPAKLKLLGLVNTLDGLCRGLSRDSAEPIHFSAERVPSDVPESIALCIYRVAQEALQNALKHSGAAVIDVRLTATLSQLTMSVNDQGRGFDPLASDTAGIGLLTMRERVELCGGTLRIEARPTGGTTIHATLPLPSPCDTRAAL